MNKCLFEHLFICLAFLVGISMLRVSRLCLVTAFTVSMAVFSTTTNSAVSATRSSFSASRPTNVSRSAINSLSIIQSTSNFKSTSVRSIGKVTLKPVFNKVTVKKTLNRPRKRTYASKTEYKYYAFNDCVPYSKSKLKGWRCIDRG